MGKSQDASAISSSLSSSSRGNDGVAVFWNSEVYPLRCGFLSRRDLSTQPGVLTPGRNRKDTRPHKAHQNRPRARARARARKWGVVGEVWKYCAKSELHPRSGLGGAERLPDWLFRGGLAGKRNWGRRFCRLFRAGFDMTGLPGLKPRAQSCYPFGMKRPNLSRRPRDF
jgi:hypothetical protein